MDGCRLSGASFNDAPLTDGWVRSSGPHLKTDLMLGSPPVQSVVDAAHVMRDS